MRSSTKSTNPALGKLLRSSFMFRRIQNSGFLPCIRRRIHLRAEPMRCAANDPCEASACLHRRVLKTTTSKTANHGDVFPRFRKPPGPPASFNDATDQHLVPGIGCHEVNECAQWLMGRGKPTRLRTVLTLGISMAKPVGTAECPPGQRSRNVQQIFEDFKKANFLCKRRRFFAIIPGFPRLRIES